jgi:hypothetical protein
MAPMKKRPARTVMEVAQARAGVLKGARICSFIAQWSIASSSLGRPITLAEYAEWWRESERSAFRHQAEFRAAFPHLENPQAIHDAAQQRAAGWQARGVSGIGQLPASLVAAA